MPNANILFQSVAPANPSDAMQGALKNQAAFNDFQQQPLRNQLLQQAVDANTQSADINNQKLTQEKAMFQLKDAAIDSLNMAPLLKSGNIDAAKSALASRIAKIQQRGGDPKDTQELLAGLNDGTITPDQAYSQLSNVVNTASRVGLIDHNNLAAKNQVIQGSNGWYSVNPDTMKANVFTDASGKPILPTAIDPTANFNVSLAKKSGDYAAGVSPDAQFNQGQQNARQANEPFIAAKTDASKQAIEMSGKALDSLKKTNLNITNIDDAISAIDKGANTGVIYAKLPSFQNASIELENVANRMGLDVINSATFGALSTDERKFALDTALPQNLPPKELKQFLIKKKQAQKKLADELKGAAIYLGKPGNTPAGWLESKQPNNQPEQKQSAPSADQIKGANPRRSEQDILKQYGL